MKILVVDDEVDLCWTLEIYLSSLGHQVSVVHSASRAIQLLINDNFNMALIDIKLPDLDGLEMVEIISLGYPNVCCFLMSGFFSHDDISINQALKTGRVAGFVPKPFQFDQINKAIALAQSRMLKVK